MTHAMLSWTMHVGLTSWIYFLLTNFTRVSAIMPSFCCLWLINGLETEFHWKQEPMRAK